MLKTLLLVTFFTLFFGCSKDETRPKVKACFDYSPRTGIQAGDTIAFSNCSDNATSYVWFFGDTNSSIEKNSKHVYYKIGSYIVRLIAKNTNSIDSITVAVDVKPKIVESKYDTIYPLTYFPAYPGSYWIYSNGDTLSIEDNYVLYYYNKSNWDAQPKYDTIYLAKFKKNSTFKQCTYIYGYKISTVTYRLPFRSILSTSLNDEFQTSEYFAGNSGYGMTIKTDTSIVIDQVKYSNVLVVVNYSWNINIGYLPWKIKEYYAKNIGLIKRERHDWTVNPPKITTDFELKRFKINK